MPTRPLINEDGMPFDAAELRSVRQQLDRLDENDRKRYRNRNAAAIANHSAAKILIVSGPGTGKSYLFLDRIDHWFEQEPDARILVSSFVRKLVADLQSDIDNDQQLTDDQKKQTTVSTLHRIARGIVERNHAKNVDTRRLMGERGRTKLRVRAKISSHFGYELIAVARGFGTIV